MLEVLTCEKTGPPLVLKEGKIAEIPYFVVDSHKNAFYCWYFSGIRQADLFHVDEHADAFQYLPCASLSEKIKLGLAQEEEVKNYVAMLTNINFIAPAMACGIIRKVIWFQPSRNSFYDEEGILSSQKVEEIFSLQQQRSLILDVDLDAFSCWLPVPARKFFLRKEPSSHQKLQLTLEILKKIPRPALITIARSQTPCYVPPTEVNELQERLLVELAKLY